VSGLRRALAGLGALGALLIAIGVALALSSDHLEQRGFDAAIGALLMATYVYVGLYAWWRRPHNRVGMLMAATGFAAFLQALTASNTSLFFSVGMALGSLYVVVAIHMLLAFPTGRVPTRGQRGLVVAGYALATIGPLLFVMFRADCGCEGPHPANALLVADRPALAQALDSGVSILGAGLVGTVVVVLVRRWRAAGRRDRSALAPVLVTGAVMVGLTALLLVLQATAGEGLAVDVIGWAGLAAFAALPFAFLAGLVRSRAWRAGAVTELVEAIGDAPAPSDMRAAVADALGDPSLTLAYWIGDSAHYVDGDGRHVELPADDDPHRTATEVEREGRRVGALVHDRALCDEPDLVRTVATAAALALDNQRLDAELRARVDELQRSRQRLLEATLAERRRLERDLHDGAQQRLVALSLQLGLVGQQLERGEAGTRAARELLDAARAEARAALEDLRELARGIHPAVLTDRGLRPALEALAARAPLAVAVTAVPDERLPAAIDAAVYFVVAEALTNVAKYAHATRAEVAVARERGVVVVEVRDDGIGGADPDAGSGLHGLADRLSVLDGRLELDSPPGRGTTLRARVPLPATVGVGAR
jgi:signal transduction histidine kinase